MRLVELADEYHLTTAEAVDLCLAAGIPATSSEAELDPGQTAQWRELADEQRRWQADEQAAEDQRVERELVEANARQAANHGSFGPLPPAPWEQDRDHHDPPVRSAPTAGEREPELTEGWTSAPAVTSGPQVSLYAAAALALAVISLIFPFVPALLAIPIALYAKSQIHKSQGKLTGERFATAAIVLSIVGFLLWVAIFGIALFKDERDRQARLHPPDIQVPVGSIEPKELAAGMCVRVPHVDLDIDQWQQVSCDGPHEAEVFYTEAFQERTSNVYPGSGNLILGARVTCAAHFADYVGRPFADSELQLAVVYPTKVAWDEEDDDLDDEKVANDHGRDLFCIAYQPKYDLINGTLKGSGR